MAIKEVTDLTMILVLDKDHTHYSDAFRNIFEGGALCKKHFPNGSSGIKMRKSGATWAIVCHFLPTCMLKMMTMPITTWWPSTLNIQWGCRTCYGYVSGYLLKVREHVQSHHKKSSRERSHFSCRKDDSSKSDSFSDSMLSDDKWSAEEFEEEEEDDDDDDEESGSYADEVSPDALDPE